MRKLSVLVPEEATVSSRTLSDLRKRYLNRELTRKEFEERVCQTLLNEYQRFNLFNRNQGTFTDYLGWLYPRLRHAIDAYKDIGSSFDAYICSLIRLAVRDYRLEEFKRHVREQAYWEACFEEPDEEDFTLAFEVLEGATLLDNPRQILILILKFYYFAPPNFVLYAAPAIGMTVKQLTGLLDKVHELRFTRDDAIHKLQEQMYSYFHRYKVYGKQLEALPETSLCREMLEQRVEKTWVRYQCLKQRLSRTKQQASNRQVAEVLGIPKGTVDATLSAVKRKLKV